MKLATLQNGTRDGALAVVSRDLRTMAPAGDIAPTLQAALDRWAEVEGRLAARYRELCEAGTRHATPFDPAQALSPLPRAFQWCDGSTYLTHFERMNRWRGMKVDERFVKEPFMYQGGSDCFLAPTEDIPAASEDWGIDLEAEIAVVTGAVAAGAGPAEAGAAIRLVLLCNDVSLRNLIPAELSKEFGFIQSKPASSFAPVAVTPDELGADWRDFRLHGAVRSSINGAWLGEPDAGGMIHGFDALVAHVAKTRAVGPGSIIGGGTVADPDPAKGTSCLTECRILEMLDGGEMKTPYLKFGDRVRIEMLHADGVSIFGAIDQKVAPFRAR